MLRKCMLISVWFSVLVACSSVPGEEWTQFRGSDYGRTSQTQVNEVWDASTVAWKTPSMSLATKLGKSTGSSYCPNRSTMAA